MLTVRQRAWADSISLNAIAIPAARFELLLAEKPAAPKRFVYRTLNSMGSAHQHRGFAGIVDERDHLFGPTKDIAKLIEICT